MSYIGVYEECCNGSNVGSPASNQYSIIGQNSNFTAEKYKFYSIDTFGESVEVTLPTDVTNGDWIGFIDKNGTFSENNLIIEFASTVIRHNAGNLVVDVDNAVFKLVYNDNNWDIFDMSVAIAEGGDGGSGVSSGYNILSITNNLNATRFNYYSIVNSIPITITLPSSPSNGDWLIISDKDGNFTNNNVTVSGSNPVLNNADGILVDFNMAKLKFVYYNNNWDVLNLT
jgi:hypothetical protein